jgi:hypothetical protein
MMPAYWMRGRLQAREYEKSKEAVNLITHDSTLAVRACEYCGGVL